MDTEQIKFTENFLNLEILGVKAEMDKRAVYAASQKLELPLLDYMTIRDLVELGGYQDDVSFLGGLIAMFGGVQEGSLCLDLDQEKLSARLRIFLKDEMAEKIAKGFLSGLTKDKYKRLVTKDGDGYLPLVLSKTRGQKRLYFQKFFVHENSLKLGMETLLQAKASQKISESAIETFIREIYSPELTIRVLKNRKPIEADKDQLDAIRLSLRSQFSIISGGPGTGKTSLMVNILRCLQRAGVRAEEILLGAPTGRAAQRMTEAVQSNINTIKEPSDEDRELLNLKGSTLHKILGYRRRSHDFYHCETNPLPAALIILDEVSMVDVVMMGRFLKAIDPARTRLVFLGDKDQLPSVEAGAVFAEMIPDGTRAERFKGRLVLLRKVYRSGKRLLKLAKQINNGESPGYLPVPFDAAIQMEHDKWGFVQNEGVKNWKSHIRLWVKHHYLSPINRRNRSFQDLVFAAGNLEANELAGSDSGNEILGQLFERVAGARILSLVRNGSYGCVGINRQIAQDLGLQFESSALGEKKFFTGAVIMVTTNDYSKELFNGDVGVVVRDKTGAYRAFFPRFGSYISFPMDLLPPWELAFSMTVHKSQGSEFDDVLLVLPEDETHKLLTREVVYTGITRAKKRIIIYGTKTGLDTALKRKIERESGLEW